MQEAEVEFKPNIKIDISYISGQLSYFFVFPYSCKQIHNPKNKGVQPTLLTYEYDDQNFEELMQKYNKLVAMTKNPERFHFTLLKGAQLKPESTPEELQNHLNRFNLNGIFLFIKNVEEQASFINECCTSELYDKEQDFGNNKSFNLHVEFENSTLYLFLSLFRSDDYQTLLDRILQKIFLQFGVKFQREEIVSIKNKRTEMKLDPSLAIDKQIKLYDSSTIVVKMANLFKVNVPSELNDILIVVDQKNQQKQFVFSEIKQMSFRAFFKKHFGKNNANKFSLLVLSELITPLQKMEKIANLFIDDREAKHKLIGHIVGESKIFYHWLLPLSKKPEGKFSLKELQIVKDQNYQHFKERKVERLQNIKHPHFKNEEALESVLVYTSQVQYRQQGSEQPITLFKEVNKFLRTNVITECAEQEVANKWKYRYVSMLLEHLSKIKTEDKYLYRGMDKDHVQKEVGEVWEPGAFTSASSNPNVATKFATDYNSEKSGMTILRMKTKSGRSIRQMSNFPEEEEYLFNPFTAFQITKKYKEKMSYLGAKYQYLIYEMEEKVADLKLPDLKANFIVWVDDKPTEGLQLIAKLNKVKNSIFLIQILSTQLLKKWIQKKYPLFKEKKYADFLFITNMTRQQNGVKNEYAGIDGMKLIREEFETSPIFVYIGDEELANKKIDGSKLDRKNITVSRQQQRLVQFLKEKGVIEQQESKSTSYCEIY